MHSRHHSPAPDDAQVVSRRTSRRASRHFAKRLHLRIWTAVLASLIIVGVLAGIVWRLTAQDVPREIVLTDAAGNHAGTARLDFREHPGAVRVELGDGKVLHARWAQGWNARAPFGFFGWLLLIVLAVGLGAYPVVKRLTRRLEELRQGVDALGEGNLSARVTVKGHDEIAWLAERFNHAAVRIETLVGSQKALLANASHELRSPLARIRMGLEMLDRGDAGRARDEIAQDISELDALIEEILLASRLDSPDAPQEAVEETDLTALCAEECARGGAEFEAHGVVVLQGRPRLLRRLIRNLIENARRYGGADRIDVALRRSLSQTGLSQVELSVCDRGPGIPEAERERVFDAFYRIKGASETAGGVGLGLALVRAIARQHGGTASCEARAGGGACFRIMLAG